MHVNHWRVGIPKVSLEIVKILDLRVCKEEAFGPFQLPSRLRFDKEREREREREREKTTTCSGRRKFNVESGEELQVILESPQRLGLEIYSIVDGIKHRSFPPPGPWHYMNLSGGL